jgi:hypothetical protein
VVAAGRKLAQLLLAAQEFPVKVRQAIFLALVIAIAQVQVVAQVQ